MPRAMQPYSKLPAVGWSEAAKMNKKAMATITIIAIIGIIFVFSFFYFTNIMGNAVKTGSGKLDALSGEKITVYKSESCGCCSGYASYLGSKGLDAEVIDLSSTDADSIKEEYSIPLDMRSCHTTIIGGYFVEGHIPLEAVEKLLQEKPSIKGIALPAMPSGSPGMPGKKYGDFVIYSIGNDGSVKEFMRI